jgi:flagellar protein FliS
MARTAAVREMYDSDKITVTPERLITMLYDRLVIDLEVAEAAVGDGDRYGANEHLVHAQAIVLELLSALDTEAWNGASRLASLYVWIVQELMAANVRQDVGAVAHCLSLVEPLRDAWHQAAIQTASAGLGAAV